VWTPTARRLISNTPRNSTARIIRSKAIPGGRDAVSVKKIDDYTLEITNKKAGKVTTTIRAVYTKDGKSRTETATGVDGQGRKVENVTQWTKQ
jgi:hypothetical protein